MELARLSHTSPDQERRPRRENDADDNAPEMNDTSASSADLYDMLGYRGAVTTTTTQQWLAMRCLSF